MAYLGNQPLASGVTSADITDGTISNADVASDAAIDVSKLSGAAATASPTFTGTVTIPTLSLNGTNVTASAAELNYVAGVTSAIQTQLDAKGTVSALSDLSITATSAELNVLDGFTGALADVNRLDVTTEGTTEASKVVTADSSGNVTFDNGIAEEYTAVTSSSNATTVNLNDGTNFSHTLTENTTFTFSNAASSGKVSTFTLKLVQDASASGYTVTWPSAVDWPSATAPTLTATASAVDYFIFISHDGGTTWYGFTAGQALG
jgi:hypothetical protein